MYFRFWLLTALLILAGCDWDVVQFVAHTTVAERVHSSLSGELAVPAAPAVDPDSFRFAMFGDPQVKADGESYLDWFRVDAAARGVDFFCVLGDLTNDATEDEQASAKAQLDSVGLPYYCTPGNHDLYQAGGWDWFKTTFGPSCYTMIVGGKLKLLFLDTAEGALGTEQFDWLDRELDDERYTKIVGTHNSAYDGLRPIMWRLGSTEERYRLMSLLTAHNVHSYVGGHLHGWRHTTIEGVNHFISALPAVEMDYGVPGYVIFTWSHDRLTWEHVEVPQQ